MTPQHPYHHILPQKLHEQADSLIDYLSYYPFETPQSCYYCGSKKFHVRGERKDGIQSYQCASCKKTFNQCTGTLFARCWHPDKWGQFAYLMFCGYSYFEIARQTGLSIHAVTIRNQKLLEYMKKHHPQLYRWRLASQTQGGVPEPAHIKEQKQQLQSWLNKRMNPKTIDCPVCEQPCRKINQTGFLYLCTHCKKRITAFTGTVFHDKPKENRHLWSEYSELLCNGMIHNDIAHQLDISPDSSCDWKDVFFELMKQLGLDSLRYWAQWQHDLSRRDSMVAIHKKRLGKI